LEEVNTMPPPPSLSSTNDFPTIGLSELGKRLIKDEDEPITKEKPAAAAAAASTSVKQENKAPNQSNEKVNLSKNNSNVLENIIFFYLETKITKNKTITKTRSRTTFPLLITFLYNHFLIFRLPPSTKSFQKNQSQIKYLHQQNHLFRMNLLHKQSHLLLHLAFQHHLLFHRHLALEQQHLNQLNRRISIIHPIRNKRMNLVQKFSFCSMVIRIYSLNMANFVKLSFKKR